MKRIAHVLLLATLPMFFGGCKALKEVQNFAKCDFRMRNLEKANLAGIEVGRKSSISDFNFLDLAKLTTAMATGNMPLTFTVNVEARNPNPVRAAMNKFDWIALIENTEVARGSMNQRVELAPNNGTAIIPVNVTTDLKRLMNSESRDALIGMALNLSDPNGLPKNVKLKVKPSIMVAGVPISYPGYITVRPEFGNN